MIILSSSEKTWLVKSSGMILGPYSIAELFEALKEKKVSLIDEVRSPESRWAFIREHYQFKGIAEVLREYHSKTKDDTETHTELFKRADELTIKYLPATTSVQDTAKISLMNSADTPAFAVSSDPKLKKRLSHESKTSKWLLWSAGLAIASGAFAYAVLRKETPKAKGSEDYLKVARMEKKLGKYESALENYKKAEALHPLDPASQLEMAPLLMVVENQNVQARQNLELLLNRMPSNDKLKQEVQSLVALSYLREIQLDEAEKRFNDILTQDPLNEAVKMNLLEIEVLQGDFEGASHKIKDLKALGVQDPYLSIYDALVSYRVTSDPQILKAADEELGHFLERTQNYEPEVQLLRAAIEKKMDNSEAVSATLNQLLNIFPDLTKEHAHDLLIHRAVLDWNYLANVCEILLHDAPSSALYSGLRSYCSYQQGDLKAALQSVDQSRLQNAQDSTLIGLNAFLLVKAGRVSEAKVLFQLPAAQESPVIHSLKARLCQEQKDFKCAEEQWKLVKNKSPHDVETFAGLAQVFISRGQKDFARDLVKQGLLISSSYQPLLELREQLNEQ